MVTIILLFLIGFLFYYALWKPRRYWIERNVKQGWPIPVLGDTINTVFRLESWAELIRKLYNRHPNERYEGLYHINRPVLMLRDPDLIKQITVKDFDHFTDHRSFFSDEIDPLWSKNLVSLKGNMWRDMRSVLSPAFTSGKMRSMFYLINEFAEEFVNFYLEKKEMETIVEMKDSFSRYSNDVIAACAFGIKCDSLRERKNDFYVMGKEATDCSQFLKNFKIFLYFLIPIVGKLFKCSLFTNDVSNFFTSIVKNTLRAREEKNIVRPDMLYLLMEARKDWKHKSETRNNYTRCATVKKSQLDKMENLHTTEISDIDITAQALIFFFAGFETVSSLMCFMAYELAVNPNIQEKLRQEVTDTYAACSGQLTYETLVKMKYMDMIISETLRKWPSVVATDRICVKPYTIQPSNPNEAPIHLRTGSIIWLPIFGLHMDETYFRDPEKFDPERFSEVNKHNINPYAYLPFGSGPRNCIGSRLALMETKVVFFHILSKFEITLVDKTTTHIVISKKQFNLTSENEFWFGLKLTN